MRTAKLSYLFSCGRAFLMANGVAIVMEGDRLRDPDLASIGEQMIRDKAESSPYGQALINSYGLDKGGLTVWTEDLIKYLAGEP